MKFAHFDIFAGISGDMILGAFVDAGLEPDRLAGELARLEIPEFQLRARKVQRGELTGTKVDLDLPEEHEHRTFRDIEAILAASPYSERVKSAVLAVFRRLAVAEAGVHGVDVEAVHFHEVGALDSILDLTGSVLALELLGVDVVSASPVPLGRGTLECAHGVMPVPAPATLACLAGIPCVPGVNDGEVTTPTGAAFIAELASEFGDLPPCRPRAVGYGAGSRERGRAPNLLRVVLGERDDAETGEIVRLECNLDDMNPQFAGFLMERLFEAGALDVGFTPIQMKKNRPGTQICVICRPADLAALRDVVFAETTTIGVRFCRMGRWELRRDWTTVATPYGEIRIKHAGGKSAPEYEDCAAAARRHGVPLREVHAAACLEAARAAV
jgi:hypothetical protein